MQKPVKKALEIAIALFIVLAFSSSVLGAEGLHIRKPTAYTDSGGSTASPGQAYDFPGAFNQNTSATTSDVSNDPSITWHSWDTRDLGTVGDINLTVTVSSSGFGDDQWGIFYDNTSATQCDSSSRTLKPLSNNNIGVTNYTAELPVGQNLSYLELCLVGVENSGPDGSTVNVYDARTVETHYYLPLWRNQSQNQSAVQTGHSLTLSAEGKNHNLSSAMLATNETGAWENKTSYGSPEFYYQGHTWVESSFTWRNASLNSGTVGWKIWYNDTNGLYNVTDTKSFSIDNSRPSTTIHNPLNATISSSTVWLNVSSSEDIRDWNYRVDSGENKSFNPNTTLNALSNGMHRLRVWSSDEAFNTNMSQVYFTVDSQYGSAQLESGPVYSSTGSLSGVSNTDSLDSKYLNWTGLSDTQTSLQRVLFVNISTDVPPDTVNSIEFGWDLKRKVYVFTNAIYDAGTLGTLNYSNTNNNSTFFMDSEFAQLTEEGQGSAWELNDKGFAFLMPENVSETDYGKVEVKIGISGSSNDLDESLVVKAYNYSSGSYVNCQSFGASDYSNLSCSMTDGDNFVNGRKLRVVFDDNLSSNSENQSTWRVDRASVTANYANPASSSYQYELGYRNYTDSSLGTLAAINPGINVQGFNPVLEDNSVVRPDGTLTGFLSFFQASNPVPDHRTLHDFSVDRFNVKLNYTVADVRSYEITVTNSTGDPVKGVNFTVFKDGSLVEKFSSFGQSFSDKLAENHNYTLRQSIPVENTQYNVTFHRLNVTTDLSPQTQLVNYSMSNAEPNITELSQVYAVNTSDMEFGKATLRVPKRKGSPDAIVHCTSWDFTASQCNSWEVNDTSDYEFRETADYVEFNVSRFDAYGTGQGEPLPNITAVKIYDVTNAADKEQGGTLVASGLNRTFLIEQQDNQRQYRFEFVMENDGTVDWTLAGEDELYHQGLNNTWDVGKIWYNLSGQKIGGDFTGNTVSWNTSKGGVLRNQDSNDTMWAKYLVNISETSSQEYNQYFEVNDTSDNAGSYDHHRLNITKYGFLAVTLKEPPNDTTLQQNVTFKMNATVTCSQGICGDVNLSARYNQSSTADTLIPEGAGTPFYTNRTNTNSCGTSMNAGETCFQTWEVNATGPLTSVHLLDANASSSLSQVPNNDSEDSRVTINQGILMSIYWDKVDFGVLDPGQENQSAVGNDAWKYNITIEENSLDVDELWVKADDLVASGWNNPATGQPYTIVAGNVSYSHQNDISTETELRNSYQQMATTVSAGTNYSTFYWMDVPEGLKTANYTGKIYFKANATR